MYIYIEKKRIYVQNTKYSSQCVMTSSDENIFRFTGHLCGGIHRSPENSLRKGQWRGALMFSLICVCLNGWVNNREAGDLRRYRAHYDVTVSGQQCTSRELYTRFALCIHIPNLFKFIFDCTFVLFIFVLFDPLNQSQTIPYQTILFLSILSI